jgi:hypothetical protein
MDSGKVVTLEPNQAVGVLVGATDSPTSVTSRMSLAAQERASFGGLGLTWILGIGVLAVLLRPRPRRRAGRHS